MKRILFTSLLLIVAHYTHAQTDTVNAGLDTTKVFFMADRAPEYPGGDKALNKYVNKLVKAGAYAGTNVWLTVVVRHDGTCKATIVRGTNNASVDAAVIKAVSSSTNWKPAEQNGKVVWAQRTVGITLK